MKNDNIKKYKDVMIMSFTIILVIIFIKIVYYGRLIIPQLNDKSVYISEPVRLSKDREVLIVLEESENINAKQLYQFGNEMLTQKRYKEAYNIYIKLLDYSIDTNDALLVYADMANCYLGIENYEKAINYANESITMIDDTCKEENVYYVYSTAAIVFYYREKQHGFIDSERTIKLLKDTLAIDVDDFNYEKFSQERNLYLYSYLADIYNFSSTHYDPEKALEIYEILLKLDPQNELNYLEIAVLYLELNDMQNAKKYIDTIKKKQVRALECLLLEGIYYTKIGDLKKAKEIVDKLKILSVSEINKSNYYYLCSSYFEENGNMDKAKEYLKKYVNMDKLQVFLHGTIKAEQRLGLNFDDIREEIRLQNEEYNKISLELEQPISD